MKICYQVATPDVAISDNVTAFQGPLENSFRRLSELGYDGVELMTRDPRELDWEEVKSLADQYHLQVVLICTGEVYGQSGLNYTDPDPEIRKEAMERTRRLIDFAAFFHADINMGRVRGKYTNQQSKEETEELAVTAFQSLADYAAERNVRIALESVTLMQINFMNTLEECAAMVERVNRPNFRLMMDVFHLNLEEKNIYDAIWKYQRYNIHVHLADNNRRYPGHCGMDFQKIFQSFHDSGYDGCFSVEVFQLPDQESCAAGAIRHLRPLAEKVYGTHTGEARK